LRQTSMESEAVNVAAALTVTGKGVLAVRK
jgi:hypothetical protein